MKNCRKLATRLAPVRVVSTLHDLGFGLCSFGEVLTSGTCLSRMQDNPFPSLFQTSPKPLILYMVPKIFRLP